MNYTEDKMPQLGRISLNSSATTITRMPTLTEEEFDEESVDSQGFHGTYELRELINSGGYGKVYRCCLKNNRCESRPLAVKVIPRENYNHEEIVISFELSECPHITQVVEVYHDEDEAYVVMEEMQGGDLLDRLAQKVFYEEKEAKVLMRTLLETLKFCHSKGIAHCDIKPENLLLRKRDDDTSMQLADFGLAQRVIDSNGSRSPLRDLVGTVDYMAPEIIVLATANDNERGYDERCDVWSCGVLMYILLAGYAPFVSNNDKDRMDLICSGAFEFHEEYWSCISSEAKDLISMMLKVNPDERVSLEDALQSEWFGYGSF